MTGVQTCALPILGKKNDIFLSSGSPAARRIPGGTPPGAPRVQLRAARGSEREREREREREGERLFTMASHIPTKMPPMRISDGRQKKRGALAKSSQVSMTHLNDFPIQESERQLAGRYSARGGWLCRLAPGQRLHLFIPSLACFTGTAVTPRPLRPLPTPSLPPVHQNNLI